MNPEVDIFLRKAKKWREEMTVLRSLVLECGLDEEMKWMHPCYTHNESNIVLIHGFKDYCALLFFKGVLLKDKKALLVQQTENVQDRRQMRFTSSTEIENLSPDIKTYIRQAIEVEQKGLKVAFKKTADFAMPDEFRKELQTNNNLKTAFQNLTPGRQRGYLLYFASAKQSKTRESRIQKYIPRILEGYGLDD